MQTRAQANVQKKSDKLSLLEFACRRKFCRQSFKLSILELALWLPPIYPNTGTPQIKQHSLKALSWWPPAQSGTYTASLGRTQRSLGRARLNPGQTTAVVSQPPQTDDLLPPDRSGAFAAAAAAATAATAVRLVPCCFFSLFLLESDWAFLFLCLSLLSC